MSLTSRIQALTTYANSITGESDTTLSDAVASLASGYGGGGGSGLEHETGTYTASSDSIPTITFSGNHTRKPDLIVMEDVSNEFTSTGNTGLLFVYINSLSLFGTAFKNTSSTTWNEVYFYGRASATLAYASGSAEYTRANVTSTGFEPYFGTTTMLCRSGQSYKWIAIWK